MSAYATLAKSPTKMSAYATTRDCKARVTLPNATTSAIALGADMNAMPLGLSKKMLVVPLDRINPSVFEIELPVNVV